MINIKKVLILEGSPRRSGNSTILSDEFARGAEEAGCCVEKLRVAGKKISGCLGCNACYRNGGVCSQRDDMEEVRNKMLAADVIVLASPIYFYSMTSQMKAVIDRTYAFYQQLEGKTFYFIISCGGKFDFKDQPCAALHAVSRMPKKAALCLASARWRQERSAGQKP